MKFYRFQLSCLCFAAVVTIFLGCRPVDLGHDMDAYKEIFNSVLSGEHPVEPLFSLLSLAAEWSGAGFRGVMWIYAIASVSVKIFFFREFAKVTWADIFVFLLIYACTFMWLYDVSQLRASLMLSFIPFLFGAGRNTTHTALGLTGVLSHYSGVIAIGQRLVKTPIVVRIVAIPVILVVVAMSSAQLNQFLVELVLEKYAGSVGNPVIYLAHPYFLSQVFFLWRYRTSDNNEFGLIALRNVWWAVITFCVLFIAFLLAGSRTAAFRFLEIGLYLSFLFSYIMFVKNRSDHYSGYVCLCLLASFALFNFILPEVPIVDAHVLNNFLNPL